MSDNLERLRAAGIAVRTPLHEPYQSVVDELSEQEVDALISLKRRFDDTGDVEGHGADTRRPWDEFFAVV